MAPSILTMPIPGSKAAPKKFKGDFSEVKKFIKHYEKLCDYNQVTSEKDKCETVTQYTSRHVSEFIEGLSSYEDSDWDQLKADILKYYDADLDTKRYKRKDLLSYVKTMRGKKIPTLTIWKKYVRGFIRIAGWLQSVNKISQDEYEGYFWEGIYKGLRAKIESRLMAKDPDKDLSKAFPVDKVISTAEKLLHRDRFDADLLLSEEDSSTSDSEDSTSTDTDSTSSNAEDSDSEEDLDYKPRKAAKKVSKKHSVAKENPKAYRGNQTGTKTPKDLSGKTKHSSETSSMEPQNEVEGLIKQLNAMSLDDPQYGLLYYRATKMDPTVIKVISPPANRVGGKNTYDSQDKTKTSYPYNQGNAPRNLPAPGNRFYNAPGGLMQDRTCFGCGEKGHSVPVCPKLLKLQAEGKIIRNYRGQVLHPNGTLVHKKPDETIIDALKREDKKPNTSHFVSVGNASTPEDETSEEEKILTIPTHEDSDDEDYYVYPVERGTKSTIKGRKERFDGVFPPPKQNVGKENIGTPAKKAMPTPRPVPTPVEPRIPQEVRPRPTPLSKSGRNNIETHKKQLITPQGIRFNEHDEDVIMEDPDVSPKKKKNDDEEENLTLEKKVTRQRTVAQKSVRMFVCFHIIALW